MGRERERMITKVRSPEYFREVDRRIMEVLHEEKAPLMLAGMDHLMALYRQVSRYPQYEEGLSGNPQYTASEELHRRRRISGLSF